MPGLQEFDVVHSVVALHRIAKSTDRGELRHDQRLTAVLAKLAATAATATTVPGAAEHDVRLLLDNAAK